MPPPTLPRAASTIAAAVALAGLAGVPAPVGAATTIKATFRAGVLTVDGTPAADTITVSHTGPGRILVNDGAVPISGATATVGNTTIVTVDGLAGGDRITLTGPSLPRGELIGGKGDDALTGSAHIDLLAGGPGRDTLTGGQGPDDVQGGTEDDVITWAPGPGQERDLVDGGPGTDVLRTTGTDQAERITISGSGAAASFFAWGVPGTALSATTEVDEVERVTLAPAAGADEVSLRGLRAEGVRRVTLDGSADGAADTIRVEGTTAADTVRVHDGRATGLPQPVSGFGADLVLTGGTDPSDTLAVTTGFAPDTVDLAGLPAGLGGTSVDGGDDADRITGHAGPDTITAGDGDDDVAAGGGTDAVDGGAGADTIRPGAGDDAVTWGHGDGNDRIDDSAGSDRLQVEGFSAFEDFALVPTGGGRVLVTRHLADVRLDTSGLERIGIAAREGKDTVAVGDLRDTTVERVDVDLRRGTDGKGDLSADTVSVAGSDGDDFLLVTGKGATAYNVTGDGPTIDVVGAEVALDGITLLGGGGADALRTHLTVPATVRIEGGEGQDAIGGNPGTDVLLGGAGDDTITATGSSGTDTVDGGAGVDRHVATGTGSSERFVVEPASAAAATTRVRRDLGGTAVLAATEIVEIRTGRGQDTVRVQDLGGTGTTGVLAQLESVPGTGAGDREVDRVELVGRTTADVVGIGATPGAASVSGLPALVDVLGLDPTDGLLVMTDGGADRIDASGVVAGRLLVTLDTGPGGDTVRATRGDDKVRTGSGDDAVDAGPGHDTVDGGGGTDTVTGAEVLVNVP